MKTPSSILFVLAVFWVLLVLSSPAPAAPLDSFDSLAGWETAPSDGVTASLRQTEGRTGQALALSFDFHGGSGWAVARKAFPLDLPDNYEFTFWIRAEAPINNLEVKLIDPSGENVWWVNRRDFAFPRDWQRIRLKKRHFQFAWGPAGGGEMKRMAQLEIAVTAGTGGKGTVYFDDLTFTPLPPARPYARTPVATASSGADAARALDGDGSTLWQGGAEAATWSADFLESREFGGLVLTWGPGEHATDYAIELSDDGRSWQTVREVRGGNGGKDFLFLPESEARHLRLAITRTARGSGAGLAEVAVEPLSFATSENDFFTAVAREAPRGSFPRAFSGEQSYWTILGVDAGDHEALLGEDGALEVGKAAFSIEPFLFADGALFTWNEARTTHSLEKGYLPIPTVTRCHGDLELAVTAVAAGPSGRSFALVRYRLRNRGGEPQGVRLFLALRPFQVNPPWQFLNTPGGVAEIGRIAFAQGQVTVDTRRVVPLVPPAGFGAATFDQGDITDFLRRGRLPEARSVADPFRHASGALVYDVPLSAGGEQDVFLAVPLDTAAAIPAAFASEEGARELFDRHFERTAADWEKKLGHVELILPAAAEPLAHTWKTALAHILINRDGAAIQPGSRSYERSWIRDGALTSTALLQLGHIEVARDFLLWFAPYLFDNGKVPCCVDRRGADPVPENDSGGEFLYLAAEYLRFSGDRKTLESLWPQIEKAVAYLDELRGQRRTAEYQTPGKRAFYGLLPESISHEGYSAKPRHSYWDDFWALRGYKDAVEMAEALGKKEQAARFAASRDQFRQDLYASLAATFEKHGIGYIPGSVELGDFDPTSTTIALSPGGELENLPRRQLLATFERYYEESKKRQAGGAWEAYTPYELRSVGAFVRLGWRDRAHEMLGFFLGHLRPAGWNQWAEVVYREARAPKFIGDMPHTWVASDFIRSFLDFFAYERESDRSLVLGAGIPRSWLGSPEGAGVRELPTAYGKLDLEMRAVENTVRVKIGGKMKVPPGGLVLQGPWAGGVRAEANGKRLAVLPGGEIVVREVPAEVVVR